MLETRGVVVVVKVAREWVAHGDIGGSCVGRKHILMSVCERERERDEHKPIIELKRVGKNNLSYTHK